MESILAIILMIIFATVIILIVSKLGLGLHVDGISSAIVVAFIIAITDALITLLLNLFDASLGAGLLGVLTFLIVDAIILMVSGEYIKGMKVNGFGGAVVAALAIAVVAEIVNLLIGLVM